MTFFHWMILLGWRPLNFPTVGLVRTTAKPQESQWPWVWDMGRLLGCATKNAVFLSEEEKNNVLVETNTNSILSYPKIGWKNVKLFRTVDYRYCMQAFIYSLYLKDAAWDLPKQLRLSWRSSVCKSGFAGELGTRTTDCLKLSNVGYHRTTMGLLNIWNVPEIQSAKKATWNWPSKYNLYPHLHFWIHNIDREHVHVIFQCVVFFF